MIITIQYVKLDASNSLSRYTTRKLEKMSKKYPWLIRAEVFFKHAKEQFEHDHICEIELSLPGPNLYAEAKEKNYEMAVKESIAELEKQLKKRKAQLTSH